MPSISPFAYFGVFHDSLTTGKFFSLSPSGYSETTFTSLGGDDGGAGKVLK
jgi:hypothetical protein